MTQTQASEYSGLPTILIRHDCPCEGSTYPLRDHWIGAFSAVGLPLGYVIDMPNYSSEEFSQPIKVWRRGDWDHYEVIDEIDARSRIESDSISRVAMGFALQAASSISARREGWRHDIFLNVCHPHFVRSHKGRQELEAATRLADAGNRIYALINCGSDLECLVFGQALASSGGYEMYRGLSIDGPVARLAAKSKQIN